jgi:hypothetical protein
MFFEESVDVQVDLLFDPGPVKFLVVELCESDQDFDHRCDVSALSKFFVFLSCKLCESVVFMVNIRLRS